MQKRPQVILLIETSNTFGRDLLRGITKYARIHGPWVFSNVPGTKLPYDYKAATGMIIRDSVVEDNRKKLEDITSSGIPVIISSALQEPSKDTFSITKDNYTTGKMGAEYFIKRGFKNLAYCGMDFYWSRQRLEGFGKYAQENGCNFYPYQTSDKAKKRPIKLNNKKISQWLRSLPPAVGLMCCNDERAKQLSELCKEENILVPEDIAILGTDNDELLCEICDPPLSSIAFNAELAGYEAAAALDAMMKGNQADKKSVAVLPTHIVTRQSTDIFATEDREVLLAMSFIHQNTNRLIQVSDVVERTCLSRRGLEKRFKKTLGHSVYEEILHVRIEAIGRMLIDTNLSITEIADVYGYEYVNNLARPFKKITGYSLLEYRKKFRPK